MTTLLLLSAVAGLLVLVSWWVRRNNLATAPAGAPALQRVAPACDMGQQLLMASATDAPPAASPAATGESAASRGGAGGGAPKPKRRKPSHPSRRAFLRNSMALGWLGVLAGFGGASLAFLWPSLRGGFGAELEVGNEEEILAFIRENRQPFPYPAGRSYIIEYNPEDDRLGEYTELTNGARLMAVYQVCVHLGCKVPWCATSQWFECPCHGSRYNRWGEYRGGPAPRGLDRFVSRVENGVLIVDTSAIVGGPSRQTASLDQPPEGASCLG
jgi:cytochrome b6-f complex iron-sulfur subunit